MPLLKFQRKPNKEHIKKLEILKDTVRELLSPIILLPYTFSSHFPEIARLNFADNKEYCLISRRCQAHVRDIVKKVDEQIDYCRKKHDIQADEALFDRDLSTLEKEIKDFSQQLNKEILKILMIFTSIFFDTGFLPYASKIKALRIAVAQDSSDLLNSAEKSNPSFQAFNCVRVLQKLENERHKPVIKQNWGLLDSAGEGNPSFRIVSSVKVFPKLEKNKNETILSSILKKITSLAEKAPFFLPLFDEILRDVPDQIHEILDRDESLNTRIRCLRQFFDENKQVDVFEYYLTALDNKLSEFIVSCQDIQEIKQKNGAIERENQVIEQAIGEILTSLAEMASRLQHFNNAGKIEKFRDKCSKKLSEITDSYSHIHDDLNAYHAELIAMKEALLTGSLFSELKAIRIAYLKDLKFYSSWNCNNLHRELDVIANNLGKTSDGVSGIFKLYEAVSNRLAVALQSASEHGDAVTTLSEFINLSFEVENVPVFIDDRNIIAQHRDEVQEAVEYRLLKNILCVATIKEYSGYLSYSLLGLSDSNAWENLENHLIKKISTLLASADFVKFEYFLENLFLFVDADDASIIARIPMEESNSLHHFLLDFQQNLKNKYLKPLLQEHTEKISDFLHFKLDDGEYHHGLNVYLDYLNKDQLLTLQKKKSERESTTIERILSTQELLALQREWRAQPILEDVYALFSAFVDGKKPLPLLSESLEKTYFDQVVMAIASFKQTKQALSQQQKTSYSTVFFLKSDSCLAKHQALFQLKEQLDQLPNHIVDEQVLEAKLSAWESHYGAMLNKHRYRFFIAIFIIFCQFIKPEFKLTTHSRQFSDRLKSDFLTANQIVSAQFSSREC